MTLADYLQKNKIDIHQLAKELGYTYNYLWRVIVGLATPSDSLTKDIVTWSNEEVDYDTLRPKKEPVKNCPTCGRKVLAPKKVGAKIRLRKRKVKDEEKR